MSTYVHNQEYAVRYESAVECLGDIIAIYASQIYALEQAESKNKVTLLCILSQSSKDMSVMRRDLRLDNHAEIDRVLQVFGPRVRALRDLPMAA